MKVMAYVAKQGQILKKFKDIDLQSIAKQFLKKHAKLSNSMLPSSYFRSNIKK